jgi:hypothetical protein
VDGELRKVARDAYVDWQGSRYSVSWQYAGREVWVQEIAREVEIHAGRERIAMNGKAQRKHSVRTFPPHHQGIALETRRAEGKILISSLRTIWQRTWDARIAKDDWIVSAT